MDMEVKSGARLAPDAVTEAYWDRKAEHGVRDPDRAVGVAEPGINRCIDRAQRPLVSRAIRKAADTLGQRGRAVLDFGCGVGRWVPALTECFPEYHGVDISSSMVRLASERYPGQRFSKLNHMTLQLDDESVDFVTSIAVLHHNAYAIQEQLLREFHRVLRPHGELLLFEALGKRNQQDVAVFYPRPAMEWVDVMERHGFQLAHTQGTAYHILSAGITKLMGSSAWMKSHFGRGVLWVDSFVTPVLSPFLPGRFHVRQLMSFRKAGDR